MHRKSAVDELSKLSQQLISDADRWIIELRVHGIRPTLGYGMMLGCSAQAERIMRGCAIVFLSTIGEEGRPLVTSVRKRVPVEKLTIGDLIRLLKLLVPALKGKGLLDDVADEKTWSVFDRVREMRNGFVHAIEVRQDATLGIEYLEAAKRLCRTRLVRAAIEIQQHETIE
jgi:hypothetical protein